MSISDSTPNTPPQHDPVYRRSLRAKVILGTLLGASSLTVMSGAAVTSALPSVEQAFQDTPNVELLTRFILTIPALSIALMAPIAGRLVDIVGGRRTLLVCLILFALAGSSALYLPSLELILVGRALLGFAVAGIMTSCTTIIADHHPIESRGHILGLQAAAMGIGGVVFVIGGGVLTEIHWRVPFSVYIAALLFIPFTIFALQERYPGHPAFHKRGARAPRQASLGSLAVIFVAGFIGMAGFYVVPVQLPFLLERNLGVAPTYTGATIALSTALGAVSALLFGKLRKRGLSYLTLLSFCFGGMGVSYLIVSVADRHAVVLLAMIFSGSGVGFLIPSVNSAITDIANPTNRGRYLGYLTTAMFTGQFLSPIIFKPLAVYGGLPFAFRMAGGFFVMLTVGLVGARCMGWGIAPPAARN